jgi:hypothetical protein
MQVLTINQLVSPLIKKEANAKKAGEDRRANETQLVELKKANQQLQ